MNISRLLLPVMAAAALVGCSKNAPEVVDDIYSSLQKGEVENIIKYAVPDSVGELTEAEKMLFTNELSGDFSKNLNTIISYEVVKVDTCGNRADFEVKTVHSGGTTFNEKGTIFHNPETGSWTLRLDSIHTENAKERTNEVMPRLRAALVTALSAKGVPYYMFENGKMLEDNIYATKDPVQTFNLYKKAAEAGYAPAYYRLGNCYSNSYGTDKDSEKAFEAYKKGAELDDTDCIYELAQCYRFGRGTAKDYDKVFELAQKLAQLNPKSNYLAWCYSNGVGTPKDDEKAFQMFKKIAEAGGAGGMYNLAIAYEYGRGTQKDFAEAIKWYKKAIENGDEDSYNNLAWMYHDGDGVAKDYEEAVRLFRLGAEKGNSWCMNGLGLCYIWGHGVSKDRSRAYEWFKKAMDLGNETARQNYNRY